MRSDESPRTPMRPTIRVIEGIASAALVLVLAVLGWMIVAAYVPEWGEVASLEIEVIGMIALLLAALSSVSVVALLHTR